MTQPWTIEHGDPGDPLLLCLHGIGSCADAFEPQFPLATATGRRLLAWDAPGYRNSADPAEPFTLDDWADAAADLIRRHGRNGADEPRADVLGVSWGGVTATRLTLRHPELVRSLTLADSSTGSGTDPERAAAMRGRATAVDGVGLAEFARSRSPLLVSSAASPELCDRVANLMATSVRQPPYTWACDSMASTDHGPRLGEITAPTLVVVGDEDGVTPPERSRELADGIAGARLETIAGAGHLANQERPDEFNAIVADFLNGLS